MESPTHYPLLVFVLSAVTMWLAAAAGVWMRHHNLLGDDQHKEDRGTVLAGASTLLALIIGFSFSMALGRYDQRKNYEEAEANAIGTEYVRADVLPAANADNVRRLLISYLDERIVFYTDRDDTHRAQINQRTAQLQAELWSQVRAPAVAQPTPVASLALAGMNDVLNSQGYTQAAFWYRVPGEAWSLMAAMGVICNLLLGYQLKPLPRGRRLVFVLPLIISVAFLLIADIDAPRHGLTRVHPQNLEALAASLR